MMITCPKCGFSQPLDRYCAKCGVDMENFKPSAPPVLKRILANPLLHIFLGLIIVAVLIIYVRRHSREEMENRVQYLKGGPTLVSRAANRYNNSEAQPPPPPPPQRTQVLGAPMAPAEEDSRKGFAESVHMHVIFAEVDHQTMETLRQDSRTSGQFTEFGDFKAGALSPSRKATSERGIRVLYRTDEKMDRERMNVATNVGEAKADGSFLGVTYSVTLSRIDANSVTGEIEVMQNFHESQELSEPAVRRTYPSTTFELAPGQTWMVTLNLPTFQQEESEASATEGIMRIFQSPQYKSRQTEFTLFFQFDKPASK